MSQFSDECRLVINNWDAYQDILKAGQQLEPELIVILAGIRKRLREQKWWKAKWYVSDSQVYSDQIYISDNRWEWKDSHFVWIGIEEFNGDALFGNKPPPSLYIWLYDKAPNLKTALRQIIKDSDNPMIGDCDISPNSPYIVRKNMSKCLPSDIDSLEDTTYAHLSEFFEYYTSFFEEFNPAVEKYLKQIK